MKLELKKRNFLIFDQKRLENIEVMISRVYFLCQMRMRNIFTIDFRMFQNECVSFFYKQK